MSTSAKLNSKPFRLARRTGFVCAPLSLACAIGLMVTANRVVVLHWGSWIVGAESGCLVAGRSSEWVYNQVGGTQASIGNAGIVSTTSWGSSFGSAWRPFHAGGATESRLLWPLWQPMLVFGVAAGYSLGMLSGGRRAQRGVCQKCGYDLGGLAAGGEEGRKCPECGTDAPAGR